MVFLVFPGVHNTSRTTAFTYSIATASGQIIPTPEPTDSVSSDRDMQKPEIQSQEKGQASATYRSPRKSPATSTPAILISEQVQAENMLEQGYAVHDIAKELQLTKKEVRKLKRKLRKEEKAAIQQRKRDKKKTAHSPR